MGQFRLTILFLLLTTISHGQQNGFGLKNIKFKGLGFSTTKETIIESFGEGKKIETNYDCGFFTNDQSGGPYYQLVYTDFNYIGSDKEKFYLQNVDFDTKGKTRLQYNDKELNGLTTKGDFINMFGETAKRYFKENPDKDSIRLFSKDSDDGAIFTFKDNRLIKFEYWTPC